MAIPQIEFGLSEIGVFEFGLEQGALVATPRFLFEGGSDALFGGVAKSNSAFFINSAKSVAAFKGQAIHELHVDAVSGIAYVELEGSSVRSGSFSSASRSDSFYNSGLINQGDLNVQASSQFAALLIEPKTLDIKGKSVVRWSSGWKLGAELHAKGNSEFQLNKSAVAHALLRIGSTGNGSAAFKARILANAVLRAESFDKFTVRADAKAVAEWKSFGATTPTIKTQALKCSRMRSVATTTSSIKGYAVSCGRFQSTNESLVSFKILAIKQAILNSDSVTTATIRSSSLVLLEMPDAWDVVIRPYENREATWK